MPLKAGATPGPHWSLSPFHSTLYFSQAGRLPVIRPLSRLHSILPSFKLLLQGIPSRDKTSQARQKAIKL